MVARSPHRANKRPGKLRPRIKNRHRQTKLHACSIRLIQQVCRLAGTPDFVAGIRDDLADQGILAALRRNDTPAIYNWMVRTVAYQGISDYVAHAYMAQHGSVTWSQIEASLVDEPACPKLKSYWHFHRCGYDKTSQTCTEPDHFPPCPLPSHPLRNGRLNQSAYSLYFFMCDIAGNDFAGWLTSTIDSAYLERADIALTRQVLLARLQGLFGVSSKMLTMIFSDLLIGASQDRPVWLEVGAGMIVVDTLVHNFLHRTGILNRHGAGHLYGPACYGPNGCAELIQRIAKRLDTRQFNPAFPANFSRFVQHGIWRYCAQQGLDICNGNRIDDRRRCQNGWCPVFSECDRALLPRPSEQSLDK